MGEDLFAPREDRNVTYILNCWGLDSYILTPPKVDIHRHAHFQAPPEEPGLTIFPVILNSCTFEKQAHI